MHWRLVNLQPAPQIQEGAPLLDLGISQKMVGVVVKYAPGLELSRGLGVCQVRSWFRVKSGPRCVVWFLLVVALAWSGGRHCRCGFVARVFRVFR